MSKARLFALVALFYATGCGGADDPRLEPSAAASLVAQADTLAARLEDGKTCGARALAERLRGAVADAELAKKADRVEHFIRCPSSPFDVRAQTAAWELARAVRMRTQNPDYRVSRSAYPRDEDPVISLFIVTGPLGDDVFPLVPEHATDGQAAVRVLMLVDGEIQDGDVAQVFDNLGRDAMEMAVDAAAKIGAGPFADLFREALDRKDPEELTDRYVDAEPTLLERALDYVDAHPEEFFLPGT